MMNALIWGIVGLAAAGVIARPFRWPEAVWALGGALLLLLLGLIPAAAAWRGVLKGLDVYLFLAGMMLLSELGRREGLFDWLAALAIACAKGSAVRLFGLVYGVGTIVTVFLSNDATAVVLTPAVYAATKAAKLQSPLPYLFICALIANAASFVLPISNPANLVVFSGGHMPPLMTWLKTFAAPSLTAIVTTYFLLWVAQRRLLLAETLAMTVERPVLSFCGKLAGIGILTAAAVLLVASARGIDLGLPTFLAGFSAAALILIVKREGPLELVRHISWGILPLVAGLFVLVEALDRTGLIRLLAEELQRGLAVPGRVAAGAGLFVGFASNLINNLPAGLIAGSAVHAAGVPKMFSGAVLIGINLGPNLSVTGSLASILWLTALRREGQQVSGWRFLKLGLIVMPIPLLLSLGALIFIG